MRIFGVDCAMNENLNTFWARLIVEELLRCGVDYFCISPGSRSTPLTAAVALNPAAKSIISYDERGGAFHALGYARATNKPAAVITTSGTAVANLYPAVVEASTDHVPLILLTADRPPELIDTGANQTMRQEQFFGNFTEWHFDLPCPSVEIAPEFVLTTVDQAVYRSGGGSAGPVHINCRYREPLVPDEKYVDDAYTRNIQQWINSDTPFTSYCQPAVSASADTIENICRIVGKTNRGMLVVGGLTSQPQQDAVGDLAGILNWPVYADVTSGLRLGDYGTNIIRYFDQELLTDKFNKKTRAKVVIHVGGRVTSKRVPQFFDANRPDHYIVIKDTPERCDPIHALTMHVQGDVATVCRDIAANMKVSDVSDYAKFFAERANDVSGLIAQRIADQSFINEPFVAAEISRAIPDGTCLFLSSSMPIRDVDLYGVSGRTGIKVAANRGISGIDGVISTAAGYAVGAECVTTLVIGDIAFIHDLNALSTLRTAPYPVIIVLINNKGGGIFHFLPISDHPDVFEKYFATPHDFSFGGASKTFALDYYSVESKESFSQSYRTALAAGRSAVIEGSTDRDDNLKLRRSIKKEIIDLLNASVTKKTPTRK